MTDSARKQQLAEAFAALRAEPATHLRKSRSTVELLVPRALNFEPERQLADVLAAILDRKSATAEWTTQIRESRNDVVLLADRAAEREQLAEALADSVDRRSATAEPATHLRKSHSADALALSEDHR